MGAGAADLRVLLRAAAGLSLAAMVGGGGVDGLGLSGGCAEGVRGTVRSSVVTDRAEVLRNPSCCSVALGLGVHLALATGSLWQYSTRPKLSDKAASWQLLSGGSELGRGYAPSLSLSLAR